MTHSAISTQASSEVSPAEKPVSQAQSNDPSVFVHSLLAAHESETIHSSISIQASLAVAPALNPTVQAQVTDPSNSEQFWFRAQGSVAQAN